MTSATRLGLVHVLLAAGLIAAPQSADAQPVKATCDVIEIHAMSGPEAKIPAELKPLEKKLKKPPFKAWNVFKVLSRASKDVAQQKAETVKLSMGQASVLLRGIQQGGKKTRVELTVTMDDQNGKRVADTKVTADVGDYIVLGRSLANDEGHLLAMTCKP